ncbi:hypothetical protein [Nocardioides euryhalodurans]|uniref:Right-handed parallel beta-helix repeat-containing protein n=1 Tax=Nocardioides euryhalodurans TaxID=2518370 RepID=A0A4V1BDZ2_9ACTN|nr:hypothetical protein [Nocardioides euryhalodurans]QBR92812.1 hypothetical protein EXE57_11395 [Nocardioides euryhalodurans]
MSLWGWERGHARTLVAVAAGVVVLLGLNTPPASARAAAPGTPTGRTDPVVATESQLRAAWSDPTRRRIDLAADIVLRDCATGDPIRESPFPLVLDGHGFTLSQACFEKRLLRQDGTGFLDVRRVRLMRGGSDGPGAALTSRGEIVLRDVTVRQNLAEEPGGGVFSMRRITVFGSRLNGNLANDDGGALYARRGGVQVYDSIISNNLVDGSGGAIGSTGDILVVRSEVDGNTTDGDGGALYADEDGDVTVIDSHIDGSDADGPGGAIFTLDGDVAVLGSTLNGNRADDRGGAISGEADVLVVNSTIARNLAVAHAGGGIWARGDLTLVNATVANNYAEGDGGGVLAAGRTTLIGTTLTANIAPIGGDLGSAGPVSSFATVIGPPVTEGVTGDTIPTRRSCRVYAASSRGYNFVSDDSCRLTDATDVTGQEPRLARLEDDPRGFVLEPLPDSPLRRVIPTGRCLGQLPDPLRGGQLLSAYVDWDDVLRRDAIGRLRDGGDGCDIGAVESPPLASGAAARPPHDSRPADSGAGVRARTRTPRNDPLATAGRAAATGALPALAALPSQTVGRPHPAAARGPLAAIGATLDRMGRRLSLLRRDAGRFDQLERCLSEVPVRQAGDPSGRWGFTYDERDGTGPGPRTALVPHRGPRPDFRLLDLAPRRACLSRAPDPNGTGADARPQLRPHPVEHRRPGVRSLLRRLAGLSRLEERIEDRAERFDHWESCLRWQPITSAGDREQDLGFQVSAAAGPSRHRAALDVDLSEWDDPDYQLLSFGRRDRPEGRRECGGEPGESVDRAPAAPSRGSRYATSSPRVEVGDDLDDLRQGIAGLREDLEDLAEPVEEITQFDECMFTVGVRALPGYDYVERDGRAARRTALAYDLSRSRGPRLNLLAFPGEEPPQIECNEDAASEGTDE